MTRNFQTVCEGRTYRVGNKEFSKVNEKSVWRDSLLQMLSMK